MIAVSQTGAVAGGHAAFGLGWTVMDCERIERDCPQCGSRNHSDVPGYGRDGWTTVACDDCDFVFLSHAPRYEALSETLAWSKQFAIEKKARRQRSPVVSWIDEKTRWRLHIARENEWDYIAEKVPAGRVLDVGCGAMNRVPDRFTPYGIEIEKAAAEVADSLMRARGGAAVHAPAIEGLGSFEDDWFDGIIMRSYLEHEAAPLEVLRVAARKLRQGGAIYVKVPNFGTINRMVRGVEWCGFRFPDHLNYFDLGSMRRMAAAAGLDFELRNTFTRYTNDNMHVFLTRP